MGADPTSMAPGTTGACSPMPSIGVLLDAEVPDRSHALESVAAHMAASHGLEAAPILRALRRRELVGSTALGDGLAIPHARVAGIERPALLFMRTRRPIPFFAPDGKPVSLVVGICVPERGDNSEHLQMLAIVAALFSEPAFRTCVTTTQNESAVRLAFESGFIRATATRRIS